MAATPTIEQFISEWVAAFNAHDLDRHMALYRPDAMLFGAVDDLQDGREAVRSYFAARGKDVRVASFPPPKVRCIGDDVAVTAGHVDFADGDEPMPYRLSWTLVREKGDWKIAQHHGSPRRG